MVSAIIFVIRKYEALFIHFQAQYFVKDEEFFGKKSSEIIKLTLKSFSIHGLICWSILRLFQDIYMQITIQGMTSNILNCSSMTIQYRAMKYYLGGCDHTCRSSIPTD